MAFPTIKKSLCSVSTMTVNKKQLMDIIDNTYGYDYTGDIAVIVQTKSRDDVISNMYDFNETVTFTLGLKLD